MRSLKQEKPPVSRDWWDLGFLWPPYVHSPPRLLWRFGWPGLRIPQPVRDSAHLLPRISVTAHRQVALYSAFASGALPSGCAWLVNSVAKKDHPATSMIPFLRPDLGFIGPALFWLFVRKPVPPKRHRNPTILRR